MNFQRLPLSSRSGSVWLIFAVALIWLSHAPLQAQDISPDEFASLFGMQGDVSGPPKTGEPTSLQTIAHDTYANVDPVSIQLADLQSQLSAQNMEISQLRLQLNSPLSVPVRNAPRYYAAYESVIVQAVQSNSSAFIVETDDGYSQVMFPWKLEHSPRVEFGVMPAAGKLGYRLRYWQFDHTTAFRADAANGLIPVGNWATVGYLAEDGDIVGGVGFIDEGNFSSSIRTDVIDMEVSRTLSSPIDIFAGLRYARINQSYSALVNESTVNPESVFANTEFRGIGPTAAIGFTHRLPLNRLSVFADARGSLLFGNQEFQTTDTVNNLSQSLNGVSVEGWSDIANAMATNAEIQFGIQYVPTNWLSMRVAMEAQHFGGIGGSNPVAVFTGADNGLTTDSPLDDDLSFFGLSIGFEAGF